MTPWKVACILFCASVGGGLLLAVAAEWLAWRARPRRAMDQAITNMCNPCNGEPGTCTCAAKSDCTHPLCGAPDTAVSDREFAAELRELLRKEEHRD